MGVETWLLLATLVMLAWIYSKLRPSYWASKGVPSPPALPVIGHFHRSLFVDRKLHTFYSENYKKFYSSSMFGVYEFQNPILVIFDPEIMKSVLVKDFDHFTDRRFINMKTGDEKDEMMSEMLSMKLGAEWKSLRTLMTPTFTSGKIKGMFPLVCDKADALVKFTMKQASENPHVDMKKNFGRYTLDTIASCAFGIECNSLVNENDIFVRKAEAIFTPSLKTLFRGMFLYIMPRLFKLCGMSLNPPEMGFFINVVKETVTARQAGQKRGDYLDLLLEAGENSKSDSKHALSDLSLVAQSVLFLIAGYDTTASLLAFSSHLLARNKDQQQLLRKELRQMVMEHGSITYQGIMGAKLLDACLQESLRLYPPASMIERACTETYTLPGTDITLRPGNLIQMPIWSIHHDPYHWPDPEAFIPDRFLRENRDDIHTFTHLPFGMGPRNCIAMRFALLEAKVALAKLLLEAEMEPAPGHEELDLTTSSGILRPAGPVNLVLKPIRKE